MKKDDTMDYVVAAFRFWARKGCKEFGEIAGEVDEKGEGIGEVAAELYDMLACAETFRFFRERGDNIVCEAVKRVYMAEPKRRPKRGELSARAKAFSREFYVSERQVYNYLEKARNEFAVGRGIRTGKTRESVQ